MTASEIAEEVFQGRKDSAYVRRTVAPHAKNSVGKSTVFWYEPDVIAWYEEVFGQRAG